MRILAAVGDRRRSTAIGVGALAVSDLHELRRRARRQELSTALPYMNSLHDIGLTAKATANDERGVPARRGDPEFLAEIEERLGQGRRLPGARRATAATGRPDRLPRRARGRAGRLVGQHCRRSSTWYAAGPRGRHRRWPSARPATCARRYEETLKAGLEEADAALMAGASYEETVADAVRDHDHPVLASASLLALGARATSWPARSGGNLARLQAAVAEAWPPAT